MPSTGFFHCNKSILPALREVYGAFIMSQTFHQSVGACCYLLVSLKVPLSFHNMCVFSSSTIFFPCLLRLVLHYFAHFGSDIRSQNI